MEWMKKLLCSLLLVSCNAVLFGQAKPLSGVYSLQGDTAKTNGYLLMKPVAGNPLKQHIDLWMTEQHSDKPIKNYAVEMTQKLHMVIVSDDFKTFMHVHPTLSPAGHFVMDQVFPAPGTYLVYADGEPNNMNHQVFRFETVVGSKSAPTARPIAPTGMGVNVGPYEVDLSSLKLRAGNMDMIDVEILKDGKPAKDLHPYLGAPAHAVFLNNKDLTYVHVHPMAMGDDTPMNMSGPMNMPAMPENGPSGPDMMLHVSVKEAGTYKMWLQFRGGDKLYVAEFAMTAK
jgi:hypothetical protein